MNQEQYDAEQEYWATMEQEREIEEKEMANDGYLTMARIMARELTKWEKENLRGKGLTGFQEIAAKDGFKAGFMAGFSGRYFDEDS